MRNLKIKKNNHDGYYYISNKLKTGQVITMYFSKENGDLFDSVESYYVGLVIGKSRKQCDSWFMSKSNYIGLELKGSGSGFDTYAFARDSLRFFEEYISKKLYPRKIKIVVTGADERRFQAYKNVLTSTRFNYVEDSWEALVKVLN
ncbi:hypothetical protein [Mammaliicoccus sciuri]|uniref:hypothetical protein n=1 Tax=Mammaliicoccus sciuri TaxID=1296 RepID=UPI002B25E96F|nr:hypothetical protein [Mammaliicoccus sciuri]WQK75262.1 hypothetical protein P3U33_05890 [Mammaliicoccus sciuri]